MDKRIQFLAVQTLAMTSKYVLSFGGYNGQEELTLTKTYDPFLLFNITNPVRFSLLTVVSFSWVLAMLGKYAIFKAVYQVDTKYVFLLWYLQKNFFSDWLSRQAIQSSGVGSPRNNNTFKISPRAHNVCPCHPV